MRVTVNSEPLELPDGANISELIAKLNLTGTRVAIEVNRRLVPRAQHTEHILRPDDTIEVVTLVGGG